TYSGVEGRVNIPYCKYAGINNCQTGFTMLIYDAIPREQKVNYDPLIQLFMFNNSSPVETGEELRHKTPINLLYGTLSRRFVGMYDFDKFNIYGTKFGVGDSPMEYEHFRYFYPFDYNYQEIEGINPIFYNIDLSNPRKCTIKPNSNIFTCGGRDYNTWEECLLLCEMSDTSQESLQSFYNYRNNVSYGYERITSSFSDTENALRDENIYELLVVLVSLDRLSERYPVGMLKTFAQGPHPNFYHNINFSSQSLRKGWSFSTGCFMGLGLGLGSETTYSLKPGEYNIYVENGNIVSNLIYTDSQNNRYYRVSYNSTLMLKDLKLTIHSKSCFLICLCTSRDVTTNVRFNLTLHEIVGEINYPMKIMDEIAKKYYTRFEFNTTNIDRPFIQKFDRTTNRYYNFSGLPFECVYEGDTGGCSTDYYARYTCIDAQTNRSIDCWCDAETCYAYNPSPTLYTGPMLKSKIGTESKPTLNYNLTDQIYESSIFLPRRLIKLNNQNAIVIPVSNRLDFQNYRLNRACFSGSSASNEIIFCNAKNPGSGCPARNTEDWNRTFKRYDFQFDDIAYLSDVVILIDRNGDGNYGRCRGKNVTKRDGTYLDLDIRVFGLPISPNPSLNSIFVPITYLGDDQFEYSGRESDFIKIAKFACAMPEYRYGSKKNYGRQGTKDKYIDASFVFDDFGRLIGCYRGTVAVNRSMDGEILFESRREYEFGLYKHLPNTRDILKYLMEGKQVVMYVSSNVPLGYLKRILRDVDTFLLVNERIRNPFIKYTASPLGALIVVTPYSYNQVKQICPTCLVAKRRSMNIDGGSISAEIPSYRTTTIDISNNMILSCPGARTNMNDPQEDILFYVVQITSVNSQTGNELIRTLETINRESGGMPIYLYIESTSSEETKKFVDVLVNISHNLSSKGVMGIHIGNMNNYLNIRSNAYYSSIELSRSVLSSTIRTPMLFEVENQNECDYIVDRNNRQQITCLLDITPQLRPPGVDVIPEYVVNVDYANFKNLSMEIALSNYFSNKQICLRIPGGKLITYKLLTEYFKGPNPVIYDEIGERSFDFIEYRYSNTTNMVCLPRLCRYQLETFCQPSQCHIKRKIKNIQGTTSISTKSLFIREYFRMFESNNDECRTNTNYVTISGFGSFVGRNDVINPDP
ncbi:MAG: hypothetical protein NZ908_02990, partial [Candidatus Micrarchaeota archaeon]|nr:hypothetical protein [Candidatus Micrarchaeota archaeon]